jgi:hypothetical protein
MTGKVGGSFLAMRDLPTSPQTIDIEIA